MDHPDGHHRGLRSGVLEAPKGATRYAHQRVPGDQEQLDADVSYLQGWASGRKSWLDGS